MSSASGLLAQPDAPAKRVLPDEAPHIVLVVPRGEAVRNFLYSETLPHLTERARVSVLSVVDDDSFLDRFRGQVDEIVPLKEHPVHPLAARLRVFIENAHDRWLWSAVAQNHWELRDVRATEKGRLFRRRLMKLTSRTLANSPTLHALTALEQRLNYGLRSSQEFDRLFERWQPDLVFNGSHIHGLAGELPLRVAQRAGIPTAGFIFSWDNLTSRSRIFVPYDDYLVWHKGMAEQLQEIYPRIPESRVHITGTPQFDFHFDDAIELPRAELCRRIGIDPARPFVLYTTGIDNHFYKEHLHVEQVIRILEGLDLPERPQLVVRTYVKGTSDEMKALAERNLPDVVFPPVLWEPRWQTPRFEDLEIFSNLLRHCSLGINAASTVSLELMLFDKPIINLDFDPDGSDLPWNLGYSRHINFDHYRHVADSGAVMVARSNADLAQMIEDGLHRPEGLARSRKEFLDQTFGTALDGGCGIRVAESLLDLARHSSAARRSV